MSAGVAAHPGLRAGVLLAFLGLASASLTHGCRTARAGQGMGQTRLAGGISLRSRAPLFDNRLSYPTGRTSLLRRHASEALLALSHVNTWAQMPAYFFDGEFSRLELRLAFGIDAQTELAVHMAALRRSGGMMDGFIEAFHATLGITQSRRDRYPRNRLRVATREGEHFVEHLGNADGGAQILSPIVVLRRALGPHSLSQALLAELHLQLPLWPDSMGFRAPGPSVLLALSTSHSLGARFDLFAAGGAMLSPQASGLYGMPLSKLGKFLLVGAGLSLRPNLRLALHYLNQDGMVEAPRFWPMHLSTNEFVLGVKFGPRAFPAAVFELGIIENSVHDANTADFGVTLAMGIATG